MGSKYFLQVTRSEQREGILLCRDTPHFFFPTIPVVWSEGFLGPGSKSEIRFGTEFLPPSKMPHTQPEVLGLCDSTTSCLLWVTSSVPTEAPGQGCSQRKEASSPELRWGCARKWRTDYTILPSCGLRKIKQGKYQPAVTLCSGQTPKMWNLQTAQWALQASSVMRWEGGTRRSEAKAVPWLSVQIPEEMSQANVLGQ